MFPVGINVPLPFRIHEIVAPMPYPLPAFRLCAFVNRDVLPLCLTLAFSHCFLSVIRCYKTVHFQTVNTILRLNWLKDRLKMLGKESSA